MENNKLVDKVNEKNSLENEKEAREECQNAFPSEKPLKDDRYLSEEDRNRLRKSFFYGNK